MTLQERVLFTALLLTPVVIGTVASSCQANDCMTDTECEATLNDFRIGFMPFSHHFNERNDNSSHGDWNEDHSGLIIENRISPHQWVGVMQYENSINNSSWTVYVAKDEFFSRSEYVDFGIVYGLVTGYDSDLPALPYVLPSMTLRPSSNTAVRTLVFPLGVAAQLMLEF